MSNEPKAGPGLDPELLAAYIDQRLSPEQRAAVEAQLAADPDSHAVLVETMKALDAEAVAKVPGVPEVPKGRVPTVRWAVAGGLLATAAALVLVVWTQPDWLQRLSQDDVDQRFQRLVAAVGPERYIEARLSNGFQFGPLRSASRGASEAAKQNPALLALDAELGPPDYDSNSARLQHFVGVTKMLIGEHDAAVLALRQASQLDPANAAILSDLAAAYLTRSRTSGTSADQSNALDAASKALAIAPTLSEAAFNRALAAELLGSDASIAYWREAVSLTSDPEWKAEVQRRLTAAESR